MTEQRGDQALRKSVISWRGSDQSMADPRIAFGELRRLLLEMGCRETVVPKSHVIFAHEPSGAESAPLAARGGIRRIGRIPPGAEIGPIPPLIVRPRHPAAAG
jgi:hypothetical protein